MLLLTVNLSIDSAHSSLQQIVVHNKGGILVQDNARVLRSINFEAYHFQQYWNEQQVEFMHQWEYNAIRFTVIEKNGKFPVDANGNLRPYPQLLDDVVQGTKKRGMTLMINYFDVTNQPNQQWMPNVDHWIQRWIDIAIRYKG